MGSLKDISQWNFNKYIKVFTHEKWLKIVVFIRKLIFVQDHNELILMEYFLLLYK